MSPGWRAAKDDLMLGVANEGVDRSPDGRWTEDKAVGLVGRRVTLKAEVCRKQQMSDPVQSEINSMSVHDTIVGIMILSSMSDGEVRLSELVTIASVIDHFPIFANYDPSNIKRVFSYMERLLSAADGLDRFLLFVKEVLPPKVHETAYLIACEVVVADGQLKQPELRLLEEIAYHLELDPLHVAAIEKSVRARYMNLA